MKDEKEDMRIKKEIDELNSKGKAEFTKDHGFSPSKTGFKLPEIDTAP